MSPRLDNNQKERMDQCARRMMATWNQLWETYAPMVNWSTVHLVLTMIQLNNFKTSQFNFVQAIMQAPFDCPILAS
jgi:hypothetical protein